MELDSKGTEDGLRVSLEHMCKSPGQASYAVSLEADVCGPHAHPVQDFKPGTSPVVQ